MVVEYVDELTGICRRNTWGSIQRCDIQYTIVKDTRHSVTNIIWLFWLVIKPTRWRVEFQPGMCTQSAVEWGGGGVHYQSQSLTSSCFVLSAAQAVFKRHILVQDNVLLSKNVVFAWHLSASFACSEKRVVIATQTTGGRRHVSWTNSEHWTRTK